MAPASAPSTALIALAGTTCPSPLASTRRMLNRWRSASKRGNCTSANGRSSASVAPSPLYKTRSPPRAYAERAAALSDEFSCACSRIFSCSNGTRTMHEVPSARPAAKKYGSIALSSIHACCRIECFAVSYARKKAAAAGTAGTSATPMPRHAPPRSLKGERPWIERVLSVSIGWSSASVIMPARPPASTALVGDICDGAGGGGLLGAASCAAAVQSGCGCALWVFGCDGRTLSSVWRQSS
mmetsp:Transcript_51528/g.118370  ORF Transcript_51528/g.118370 Transcript_51528/m.118370 type:complete len:241 (+) Transcript_51528:429-1151(+)